MTPTEHSLDLHELALALVREKGRPRLIGSSVVTEYSYGVLTIRHQAEQGSLDIWFARRVLTVERWAGKPQLILYEPGSREGDLTEAAKVAA
jgi:hypothetical protein